MGKIYKSMTDLIGNTPLLELTNYEKAKGLEARILAKVEFFNPNQSIKDRAALAMIEDAEKAGKIKKGDTIVEITSGNTGIGLAAIAAVKGYKFRVYIEDNVSIERTQVIKAFGGEVRMLMQDEHIKKALEETDGDFIAAAEALKEEVLDKEDGVFFIDQCSNTSNPAAHESTTGPEIWNDTDGDVDILVANVGTGGTVSGTGRYLRSKNPDIQIIALQPGPGSIPDDDNPSPEQITGVHRFEGIPDERIPATMDRKIYDEKFEVETPQAYRAARELAHLEGILVGTSSGAAVYAAEQVARRPENKGKTIVTILPDTGLRYLSTNLFNEEYKV